VRSGDLLIHFKLPDQGTIKLSEIKGEFNKGDNLKAYYGATNGIPSSGNIKLTDFYGKSDAPAPTPPSGYYSRSLTVYRNQKGQSQNGLAYKFLTSLRGDVVGYPGKFSTRAGYSQDTTIPRYPPEGGTPMFMFQSVNDANFYNSYEKAYFQSDDASSETEVYTTWNDSVANGMTLYYEDPMASTQSINYTYAYNSFLGALVRGAIERDQGFSIRLSG